jgi:hypothetical protein
MGALFPGTIAIGIDYVVSVATEGLAFGTQEVLFIRLSEE